MRNRLCAPVDEEIISFKAIEALFPSDNVLSESKLARFKVNLGVMVPSPPTTTNSKTNDDYLLVFEPWQVRVNEKDNLLYFTDVSEGFIYILDLSTHRVLKRVLINRLPSYFDYFDDKIIYCTDQNSVQCMDTSGKIVWSSGVRGPNGVCVGNDSIFVTCSKSNCVYILNRESGEQIGQFGKPGKGQDQLLFPHDITIGWDENLFICDTGNHRIQVFSKSGEHLFNFGRRGSNKGEFESPKGIIFDKKMNRIIVGDTMNNRIQIFDCKGKFLKTFKVKSDDLAFMRPIGLSISYDLGELYVADFANHMVHIFQNWYRKVHSIETVLVNNFNFCDITFHFE